MQFRPQLVSQRGCVASCRENCLVQQRLKLPSLKLYRFHFFTCLCTDNCKGTTSWKERLPPPPPRPPCLQKEKIQFGKRVCIILHLPNSRKCELEVAFPIFKFCLPEFWKTSHLVCSKKIAFVLFIDPIFQLCSKVFRRL